MALSIKSVTWIPLVILIALLRKQATCSPLYASSRWIIDENGNRVKLACGNWVGHLDAMVPEGLNKRPLDDITKSVRSMGFNCVRLTWAVFMFTNSSLSGMTVRQSMRRLNLVDAEAGIGTYNPSLLDLTIIDAYKAVVSSLGANGVMIVLDNQISRPEWCCGYTDGNGFFGDSDFDPNVWLQALNTLASTFLDAPQVVGMSLRNELRGPRQNQQDWYRYMERGAQTVHTANPNVLVILSGLSYDTDLSFIATSPVTLDFVEKLVFELHWYSFGDSNTWSTVNPNQACAQITSSFISRGAFLVLPDANYTAPLFLSEFGIDERGGNTNDDKYINCLMSFAAQNDVDWALWAFQGSYYYRSGSINPEEEYGILDGNWTGPRNASFLFRVNALQKPFRGPGLAQSRPYQIIYNPATGTCLQRTDSSGGQLKLGPCVLAEHWNYTENNNIVLSETSTVCVQANGLGMPATLRIPCLGVNTEWRMISETQLQLATNLANGTVVCLDGIASPSIVTNPCKCTSGDPNCDPESQWFAIVNATRSSPSTQKILYNV